MTGIRSSLVFRDEEQRKDFNVTLAQVGAKQNLTIQALFDEFIESHKLQEVVESRLNRETGKKARK